MENDRVGVKVFCVLAVGLCLFYFTQLTLSAAELRWTNSLRGDWSNPSNWDPNVTPTSADDVYITEAADYIVTLSGPAEAGRVFLGGTNGVQTLSITSGYLATSQLFQSMTNGVLELNSAELHATGEVRIGGSLIATNGTNGILGLSSVTVESTGQLYIKDFVISPNLVLSTPRSWTNHGQIIWLGGFLRAPGSTRFDNAVGAIIEIQEAAEVDSISLRPLSIINAGLIKKTMGSNLVIFGRSGSVTLTNIGHVEIKSGGFSFTNSNDRYTQAAPGRTSLSGGTIRSFNAIQIEGGTLNGPGRIVGQLTQRGGAIQPGFPAGILEITGQYIMEPKAALNIMVGGGMEGTGFDKVKVGGTARVQGIVNICMASNFIPSIGQTFEILRCNLRFTEPATYSGLCSKGVDFEVTEQDTGITLTGISSGITEPFLKLFRSGSEHMVCWPTGHKVSLESTPHFTQANWSKVSTVASNSFRFQTSEPSRFFRLSSD